jgi:hypothetical protein
MPIMTPPKRNHKRKAKERLITAGKVVGVIAAMAGVAYWVFKTTDDEGETAMSFDYADKWFNSATDSELDIEREKVRVVFSTAGRNNLSDSEVNKLERLLNRFDKEMSNRAWDGRTDYKYPAPREHGWYLPNDD